MCEYVHVCVYVCIYVFVCVCVGLRLVLGVFNHSPSIFGGRISQLNQLLSILDNLVILPACSKD